MAQFQETPFPLLSIILTATLITTTVSAAATSPPDSHQQEQLDNIIDALVGAGGFSGWSDLLSDAPPQDFPFSATFFVPSDQSSGDAPPHANSILNPLVLAYHIVPQRLSFSDLLLFRNHARLPTLLPDRSILITRNSSEGFALDGTRLTRPDLYLSASVAVHAVANVLDHRLYGDPHDFRPVRIPPVPGTPRAAVEPPAIAIYDEDEFFTGGSPARGYVGPAVVFLIASCSALFLDDGCCSVS